MPRLLSLDRMPTRILSNYGSESTRTIYEAAACCLQRYRSDSGGGGVGVRDQCQCSGKFEPSNSFAFAVISDEHVLW